MGIGARLKEARMEKDISLDMLQDTTKIQKRYLVAIEEENFSVLPGKFYAKAFIKEYAIAVGLDPNQLMEEFQEDIPSPEEDTTTQYTRIQRSRKDNMPSKSNAIFSFIPTLIVVILIIGIVFLAWWFFTEANKDDESNEITQSDDNGGFYRSETGDGNSELATEDNDANVVDENETEDNATVEDEIIEEIEPEITIKEQGTGTPPLSELELSNVGESLNIDFAALNQQVWLDVKNADGQVLYSGMVTPNEPLTLDLTGENRIFLNVGHAPNLTITINDELVLEYPVDPNERGKDHQQLWINVVEGNE